MADGSGKHHITKAVVLPVEWRVAAVERAPLPVAQIYPMHDLALGRRKEATAKASKIDTARSKIFGRTKPEAKDDPFLQRLSRLT